MAIAISQEMMDTVKAAIMDRCCEHSNHGGYVYGPRGKCDHVVWIRPWYCSARTVTQR